MKKRLIFTFIGILFLNVRVSAQSVEKRLQAFIDSVYAANPSAVGIMVHVESPDFGISWSGASGYPSKETDTNLDPDQPALIASNMKTYVSATILRLVEQGKLSIDQSINQLLSDKTKRIFEGGGYNLDLIKIKHLLSHTSGIQDYANQDFIDFINRNKSYRWTRDEQLALTIEAGPPLGDPETTYHYTDANYLLLTEIIEQIAKKPFYRAMRELLFFDSLGLSDTWIPTLEKKPALAKPLVHQYWKAYEWDSYDVDVSVDLYGGGGIACTTRDLANFFDHLFNFEIIRDSTVFDMIFTEIPTKDPNPSNYYLGITPYEFQGLRAYGHSGFWGTIVLYFPDINTSVAVFVLERDKRELSQGIIDKTIGLLSE